MVHKLALLVASLAASLVLAVALGAAGFAPGATPTPRAATTTTTTTAAADVAPTPTVQIDPVYIAPAPPRKTVTVHKVVKSAGGGESEGADGAEGGD